MTDLIRQLEKTCKAYYQCVNLCLASGKVTEEQIEGLENHMKEQHVKRS